MRVIGVHADGGMRDRILLPAKQMYKCETLPVLQIPLVETLGVGSHAVGRATGGAVDAGVRLYRRQGFDGGSDPPAPTW